MKEGKEFSGRVDVTGGGGAKAGGWPLEVSSPIKPIADVLGSSIKDVSKDYSEKSLDVSNPDSKATSKQI